MQAPGGQQHFRQASGRISDIIALMHHLHLGVIYTHLWGLSRGNAGTAGQLLRSRCRGRQSQREEREERLSGVLVKVCISYRCS